VPTWLDFKLIRIVSIHNPGVEDNDTFYGRVKTFICDSVIDDVSFNTELELGRTRMINNHLCPVKVRSNITPPF
jgi:hypothetical protein